MDLGLDVLGLDDGLELWGFGALGAGVRLGGLGLLRLRVKVCGVCCLAHLGVGREYGNRYYIRTIFPYSILRTG